MTTERFILELYQSGSRGKIHLNMPLWNSGVIDEVIANILRTLHKDVPVDYSRVVAKCNRLGLDIDVQGGVGEIRREIDTVIDRISEFSKEVASFDQDRVIAILKNIPNSSGILSFLISKDYISSSSSLEISITEKGKRLFGLSESHFLSNIRGPYAIDLKVALVEGGWNFSDGIEQVRGTLPEVNISPLLDDTVVEKIEFFLSEKLLHTETGERSDKAMRTRIKKALIDGLYEGYPLLSKTSEDSLEDERSPLRIKKGLKILLSVPREEFIEETSRHLGNFGASSAIFLANLIEEGGYQFPDK